MDGRFCKIDASSYSFKKGGGIYCNNEGEPEMAQIMKDKFGKPNGNSLRADESTWKYILEYQGVYLTIYDFNNFWSLGFLELEDHVPDYEIIYAISRMLFNYLNEEVQSKLNQREAVAS